MSSKGYFILAIIWIILSPFCFMVGNTVPGIVWLCAAISELVIALIKRSKENVR